MQKYFFILLFGIISITIGLVGEYFLRENSVGRKGSENINSGNLTNQAILARPQVSDIYNSTMNDEMGANPESTREIRESSLDTPYKITIENSQSGVQIYLPAFFSQTIEEQNEFSQKLSNLGTYELTINIFDYKAIDLGVLQRLYSHIQPSFSHIIFRFYDVPVNFYELFDQFPFNLTNKDLVIEFYGEMFPDQFKMDSVLYHLDKMFKRTLNEKDKLENLSLDSEEAGNIYFLLTSDGIEILKHLPAKSFNSNRIMIDARSSGPGDTLYGKEKIEKFFGESTIENIYIGGIGEKKDGKIILYGF